jgi:hypothetical protein
LIIPNERSLSVILPSKGKWDKEKMIWGSLYLDKNIIFIGLWNHGSDMGSARSIGGTPMEDVHFPATQ